MHEPGIGTRLSWVRARRYGGYEDFGSIERRTIREETADDQHAAILKGHCRWMAAC
jgi:hypothetical protein